MSDTVSVICPRCGEKFDIDSAHKTCFCPSCGNKIDVEENRAEEEIVDVGASEVETAKLEKQNDTGRNKISDICYRAISKIEREVTDTGNRKKLTEVAGLMALVIIVIVAWIVIGISRPTADHTGEVKVPVSAISFDGRNYEDVVMQLRSSGFTNITVSPDEDLITGWLTKENTVSSVSINGDDEFQKGAWYSPDVTIVVRYHSFRNRNTANNNSRTTESSRASQSYSQITIDKSASIPSASRGERNGFDASTNFSLDFHGVTFSIPSYYEEWETGNFEKAYAVTGEDGCSIGFVETDIDEQSVKLDSFTDTQKSRYVDSLATVLVDSLSNVKVEGYKKITVGEIYGCEITLDAEGYYARISCLLCPKTNKLIAVVISTDDDSEYSYLVDFEKIIESVCYVS